jgi:hypothetical protein
MITFHDTPCKRGTGTIHRGYYRKTRNGVTYPQHRLAYMDKHGLISSDLVIHHECENKWCVNPDHLTPMTRSEHQALHANVKAKQYYDNLDKCAKGHPLDGRNAKQRYCKTCRTASWRRYNAKQSTKDYWHARYIAKKEEANV